MSSRLRSIAIVAASTLLAINMLLGLFPPASSVGGAIASKLKPVRGATGSWQKWDMFHTIPRLHAANVRVVTVDGAGKQREFGPWLPGLKDRGPSYAVRFHYALMRMLEGGEQGSADYIAGLRRALKTADPDAVEFSIRLELDFTRELSLIRKDGQIARHATHTLGPFPIQDGQSG